MKKDYNACNKDTLKMWVETVLQVVSAPNTPEVGSPIVIPRPRDTSALSDLFGALRNVGEPKALVMPAVRYADLRRHDRVLDIETHAWIIKTGIQGHLYSCPIITAPRGTDPTKVWVVGRVINGWGWIKQEGAVQLS